MNICFSRESFSEYNDLKTFLLSEKQVCVRNSVSQSGQDLGFHIFKCWFHMKQRFLKSTDFVTNLGVQITMLKSFSPCCNLALNLR